MASTCLTPEILDSGTGTGRWMVVMYNNETNSFDEVIAILMKATGCSLNEAYTETWEAHHFGKSPVHFADFDDCEIIAYMISSIGVRTQVCREWND